MDWLNGLAIATACGIGGIYGAMKRKKPKDESPFIDSEARRTPEQPSRQSRRQAPRAPVVLPHDPKR